VDSIEMAGEVMERARQAVEQPIEVDGKIFTVGFSGGLALAQTGESAEALIRNSDAALYAAKHGGRGRCEVYNASFRRRTTMQRALEQELRGAIGREEFVLHYQPIVDLTDGRTVSYEALVRWQHPTFGLLAPGEFIELAEESDCIVDLGSAVIEQACRFLARHPDADWQVFVNVSPRQVGRNLPGTVTRSLAANGVPARRLGIEITENGVLNVTGSSLREMTELRELGIDILVDDFGTGYSALSSVMETPVTGLKLDQSFTARLGLSGPADRITSTVATLVKSLSLHGVAEGIETVEQAQLLRQHGWRYGQGYLFGRPAPAGSLGLEPGAVAASTVGCDS
jgi:EAL domain-containing protein (putative c-di-GMP-specific phosphodiesterase class I)